MAVKPTSTLVADPSAPRRLCVFCGSRPGSSPSFTDAARELGRQLAERDVELVYGGGGTGMMGALANGCLDAGGRAIGVIPRDLFEAEHLHTGLSEVIATSGMHERKLRMTELASAFAVLPGGYGTLDETFEAVTWQQLRIHDKPIGLLDVDRFFAPLLSLLEHLERTGFISRGCPRPLVARAAGPLVDELLREAVARRTAPQTSPDTAP